MSEYSLPITVLPWGKGLQSMSSIIIEMPNEEGPPTKLIQFGLVFTDGTAVGLVLDEKAAQVISDDLGKKARSIRTGLEVVEGNGQMQIPMPRRIKDQPQA